MRLPASNSRLTALKVLGGYLVFAIMLSTWSVARGSESTAWGGPRVALAVYVILLVSTVWSARSTNAAATVIGDWLPLLALPLLYGGIPGTAIGTGPFDSAVQGWDRLIFRTDAARTFAGAMPSMAVSEVLHAAYLSYYAIIYGPPLMMYLRGDGEAFAKTVSAFTLAMVACFVVFCLAPVEGPRYAWPPPAGVAEGFFRRVVSQILEGGSSRGTAFPSSHQAIALVMGLSSMSWRRRLGLPVLVLSLLLGLGAVYGGFHYGVDMLAGAAVGLGAWAWAWGWKASKAGPA
jgi:membrane-associated phospholipid phosphatase